MLLLAEPCELRRRGRYVSSNKVLNDRELFQVVFHRTYRRDAHLTVVGHAFRSASTYACS